MSFARYRELAAWYDEHYDLPLGANPAFPLFESTGSGVLLTAPHAVRTVTAAGETKVADYSTGALVRAVGEASGGACLVAHSPWPGNANVDPFESCVFKQRMVGLLAGGLTSVLDVHGMRNDHGADVCVGTHVDGPSALADYVSDVLGEHGLRCRHNDPFGARSPHTVTATALRSGAHAVQLEIATRWREPVARPDEAARLYGALVELTRGVAAGAFLARAGA